MGVSFYVRNQIKWEDPEDDENPKSGRNRKNTQDQWKQHITTIQSRWEEEIEHSTSKEKKKKEILFFWRKKQHKIIPNLPVDVTQTTDGVRWCKNNPSSFIHHRRRQDEDGRTEEEWVSEWVNEGVLEVCSGFKEDKKKKSELPTTHYYPLTTTKKASGSPPPCPVLYHKQQPTKKRERERGMGEGEEEEEEKWMDDGSFSSSELSAVYSFTKNFFLPFFCSPPWIFLILSITPLDCFSYWNDQNRAVWICMGNFGHIPFIDDFSVFGCISFSTLNPVIVVL